MTQPSSLPLSVRSVEWIRANHGAWLVDTVEHYWYSWNTPAPGGPALKKLPSVGVRSPVSSARVDDGSGPIGRRGSSRCIRPALPARVSGTRPASSSPERPRVLVTTFRPDRTYPRVVAYVAWIDHTRTQLALYPGRYEPPGASPRGPMEVPLGQRAEAARDVQQRLHLQRRARRLRGRRADGDAAPARDRNGRRVPWTATSTFARWCGGSAPAALARARPAEPAADRRPRPAEPAALQRAACGGARSATPCGSGARRSASTGTAT